MKENSIYSLESKLKSETNKNITILHRGYFYTFTWDGGLFTIKEKDVLPSRSIHLYEAFKEEYPELWL